MNANSAQPDQLLPLLDSLQLDKGWQATVLLRYADPGGMLPRPWPEATIADWQRVLADPAALFQSDAQGHLISDGRSSRVLRRQLDLNSAKPEVFCKQSRRRNLLRKSVGLFRRTRPSRNWQIAWDLLAAGIPTAVPVAVFEKRLFGLKIAAGIITQSLLPGKELRLFALQEAPHLPQGQIRQVTESLARLICRLHEKGFFHRDLKGKNIFVHFDQTASPRFYFLDLDGCRHNSKSSLKKVKSLARLARASLDWPAVRATTRLRFLKGYLRDWQDCSADWKKWWHRIDRQVRRKIAPRKKK